MPDVTIHIDTSEFRAALHKYRAISTRGLAEDINQKAYSIMISAVALTKAARKSDISAYLESESSKYPPAPVAPVLINWFRGGGGRPHKIIGRGPGFYGSEMKQKVQEFTRQQRDATNFLRAGWLSAVAIYARAIGKSPGKNAVRFLARYGFGKYGGGEAGKPGWNPTATFYNMAFSRWTSTNRGLAIALAGVGAAVAQEVVRMGDYIAKKMQQRSDKFSQSFLRF